MARDRCLEALSEAATEKDARLLWRRAKGYNMLANELRTDAAGERNGSARPHAQAPCGGRLAHDLDL